MRRTRLLLASAALAGCALLAGAVVPPGARAASADGDGSARDEIVVAPGDAGTTALVIYEGGTAVVQEHRRVSLPAGLGNLAFPEVPTGADAASLRLWVTEDGGGSGDVIVLARSLAADVPNRHRLLELSVGREVTVLVDDQGEGAPPRAVPATVLSVAEDVVLRMDGGVRVGLPGEVVFPDLPAGLRTTPTLLATVETAQPGPRTLALSYLTGGLRWAADYTLDLSDDMTRGDMSGWATITNDSGRTFRDARLTLSTGTVQVVSRPPSGSPQPMMMAAGRSSVMAEADMAVMPAPPTPEGQGGLYFYPVERPVSLAHRQTRQVALMRAPDIGLAPRFVIPDPGTAPYTRQSFERDPVEAERALRIENTGESGLGQPMPAGIVRVWQPGPHGVPRFLGSDRLRHLPAGEHADLNLGTDFDIRATYTRTAFRETARWKDQVETESRHRVVLSNAKAEQTVTVIVEATLPGDWSIVSQSHPHERISDSRVRWTITVPPSDEAVLTHTAKARF